MELSRIAALAVPCDIITQHPASSYMMMAYAHTAQKDFPLVKCWPPSFLPFSFYYKLLRAHLFYYRPITTSLLDFWLSLDNQEIGCWGETPQTEAYLVHSVQQLLPPMENWPQPTPLWSAVHVLRNYFSAYSDDHLLRTIIPRALQNNKERSLFFTHKDLWGSKVQREGILKAVRGMHPQEEFGTRLKNLAENSFELYRDPDDTNGLLAVSARQQDLDEIYMR